MCLNGKCRFNVAGDECSESCTGYDTYCDGESSKCTPFKKVGEKCYDNEDCGDEYIYFCDSVNGDYGVCKKLPIKGQSCVSEECQLGYHCMSDVCVKDVGLDGACDDDDECEIGYACSNDNVCKYIFPVEGDYCDNNHIKCPRGHLCTNSKCVKNTDECRYDDDCKKNEKMTKLFVY